MIPKGFITVQREGTKAIGGQQEPAEKQYEEIRLSPDKFHSILDRTLSFLLLKKDGYKVGEELTLSEYTAVEKTGRRLIVKIRYIWKDWTGLEEDYCIIGIWQVAFLPVATEQL